MTIAVDMGRKATKTNKQNPLDLLSWGNKQLLHTFLCNSQTYTLGVVDDQMHCWPLALRNSALGHPQHLGVIVLIITQPPI